MLDLENSSRPSIRAPRQRPSRTRSCCAERPLRVAGGAEAAAARSADPSASPPIGLPPGKGRGRESLARVRHAFSVKAVETRELLEIQSRRIGDLCERVVYGPLHTRPHVLALVDVATDAVVVFQRGAANTRRRRDDLSIDTLCA